MVHTVGVEWQSVTRQPVPLRLQFVAAPCRRNTRRRIGTCAAWVCRQVLEKDTSGNAL